MNEQFKMAIIANDLDSMNMRIEDLRAHPKLTDAQVAVQKARDLMREAMGDIHQEDMRKRYDV